VDKVSAWVTFAEDLVAGHPCPCRTLIAEERKRAPDHTARNASKAEIGELDLW
jgi:hypothetical protein